MGISQSNPSSSATIEKKFEVFLSFRGETRHGFTNNLYEALRDKSIETFRDDRLEKGDEIGPNLLKTIRESKISVVIFSKDYASSKWCLRELVEIMECREKNGRTVIPVFYNVAVSDVRHQEGSFKDGFDQLEKKFLEKLAKDRAAWTEHVDSANVSKQSESCMASFDERPKEFHIEMQKWREALTKASHVDGYDSSVTRPDSVLINELVRSISEKLMSEYMPSPCDFKGLYGFEERFKQVMSLLCLDNTDIRIIGIWGMGGIGKTTIADAIFHQIPYDEYGKCFIQNVRQRLEQCGGLVSVQQEVLSKVLNDQDIKLDSLTLPRHIKERLCRKKVFIVLDDVDNFLKLQKLAGGIDRLGLGSRIIITTRRRDILYNCGVNDDYIYEVKGLSNQEAHQLFCEYAFRQSPLPEDLMALSHKILWAINGNPLGLIVAGSSLLKLNKVEWQSALNRLKKSSEILEVLKISYNGLEDEDKHTFLDIACFFVGKHVDYLVKILDNCSHSLRVLFHRSLITISNDKIIQMHDLLQEMGREIVCREDLNNPGNRSRLWTQEDVLDTLKNDDGTTAVRGIFLNMSKMNVEHLSSQAFEKMKNLRILKFYDSAWYYNFVVNGAELYSSNVRFSNDISYLSNKLKSLNWLGYPLKALPSNFIPKNLVELNLRHSNIEMLWEDNRHAPKLKWIILKSCPYLLKVNLLDAPLLEKIDIVSCESLLGLPSHNRFLSLAYLHLKSCKKLTRISNLLDAPLLKKIDIQRCENLLGFPSPVHNFNNLHELNIRDCKNFQSFPNNIPFLSLVSLDLSGCMNLAKISDLLDAPLLQKINLCDCKSLLNFPPPVNHFNNLRELNMRDCQNLQSFPNNIPFPSLVSLDLSGCINLARISDLLDAPLVQMIDLCHCKSLLNFPPPAHHFNNLRELNMRNCKNLQSFPKNVPFLSLVSIDLSGCIKLARISYIFDAPLLQMINLCDCKSLLDFPLPAHHFHNLHELNIRDCPNLQSFPNNIPFPSLVSLDLSRCINLARISDLLDAPLLQMINLCDCKSLLDFPPPAYHFNNLRELNMRNCRKLKSFPNNIPFPSLVSLDLFGCINLARISDLLDAPLLQKINLCDCKSLLDFPPPAHHFNNLRELNMRDCQNLLSFPNNIPFPSLISLDLSRCINLARISDLLDAPLLQMINLCDCKSLLNFPPPAYHFNNLRELNMRNCQKLKSFPSNIPFPSLISLDLSRCIRLARISDLLDVPLLEKINLCDCKSLLDFPPPAHHFNNLRELNMRNCQNLQSFPNNIPFPSLVSLDLSRCLNLVRISDLLDTPFLEEINLCDCKSLLDFPPPANHFNNLCELNMRDCQNLQSFPNNIPFPSLVSLDLSGCINLTRISDLLDVPLLQIINLCDCRSLLYFPPPAYHFNNLRELNMRDCENLRGFPNNISFPSLVSFDLSGCINLARISDLLDAPLLQKINLCDCKSLLDFPPPAHQFDNLRELNMSNCQNLQSFPKNIRFRSLVSLSLSRCINLARISDLLDAPLLQKINLCDCKSLLNFPSPAHQFDNLRELNMSNCQNLQSFPNNIPFPSLVSLDLSRCVNLARISDLLDAPLLQMINLCDCKSLLDFPPPAHHFNNLRKLNMRDCQNLRSFPNNIPFPSLVSLDLFGCINLARISDLLDAPLLQKINLCDCKSLLDFPPPAHQFDNLRELNMSNCQNLQSFPNNIRFRSLVSLSLSRCINLVRISDLLDAPLLQKINICDCKRLLDFPSPARHFNNLRELNMRDCQNLHSFPNNILFPSLVSLDLSRCVNLARISDLLDAPLLQMINLCDCKSLLDFPPPAHHFNNLRKLNMRDCQNLKSFPNNIPFPSLVSLDLSRCINLARISDLLDTPLLQMINLCDYKSLLDFPPPAHHFNNLRKLNMRDCQNLRSFPNNIPFPSLVSLDLSRCINLARISDLLDTPLVQMINLCDCKSLLEFPPPAHHFNNLRELNIRDCQNLQSFPNNIPFPSIVSLDLSRCINLARISDLLDAPLLQVVNLCGCKSLRDFPPPARHFNNLCELNMRDCENILSFPNNIPFPSLISLDLSKCINLARISDFLDAPLLENINLINCKSLIDFPPPAQHFNKLRNLKLNYCKNLQSFPSNNIHFPSLNSFEINGCIKLTKCPHISGNIKKLYMRNTAIKDVPSSIENLPRLVKLDLAGCTRLKQIPNNIHKLKALKKLNLSNCSALECFPEISDTMGSLKILNLRGTAIKELHHSIENLSGLEMMYLCECKNLEMLPISIYNLTSLNILSLSGCSKLENFPTNSVTDLSNRGESATTKSPICRLGKCELYFTNCLNLNKTAVTNIMELQINQQRDMTTKGIETQAVDLMFFYPGSEVLSWFKHRTDGFLINIQMSGYDGLNGHLIGLAACAVIEFYDDEGYDFEVLRISIGYRHHCHCKDHSGWIDNIIVPLLYSDHVALWYSNALVLELCGECTNYFFEFYPKGGSPNCRVKYCGVCPIYEKHNINLPSIANETCGATDLDFGETSVK